ncbi:hypothetical protein [Brachybacterium massiliense]|uniref:hypothetical protein n=1 Tax=Brachybacterium massiliense TaxID=1755098 RepID=UPI000B3BC110|nr:hypothetical protein [Brachybacterium massiliense]
MSMYYFRAQAYAAHGVYVNTASNRDQANPNEIIPFLDDLESHGVTITHSAAYRALIEYTAPDYTDPDPFTTDPATAHATVTEHSLRTGASGTAMSRTWHQYLINAGRALLDSMTAEADTYITAMQPAYNTAAAAVTAALTLDLDENTSYAALIEDGTPEQIDAWRAYLDAVKVLDRIAATRIALSAWLGIAPQGNVNHATEVPDYTPAFMKTSAPMKLNPSPVSANALTHRWLAMQNRAGTALHLSTVADLDAVGYANGRAASVA